MSTDYMNGEQTYQTANTLIDVLIMKEVRKRTHRKVSDNQRIREAAASRITSDLRRIETSWAAAHHA